LLKKQLSFMTVFYFEQRDVQKASCEINSTIQRSPIRKF